MKVFTAKLRDIVGRIANKRSIAPRDVLFEAQLPFLRPKFGSFLKDIERPTDGGPYVFRCEFPPHVSVEKFYNGITDGNWGDFCIVGVSISCDVVRGSWVKAAVKVDVDR